MGTGKVVLVEMAKNKIKRTKRESTKTVEKNHLKL
jgi:hypothetical protein